MNASATAAEIVRIAVVTQLVSVAERAVLDDEWDTALEALLSVLEIVPDHGFATAAVQHLTAVTRADLA